MIGDQRRVAVVVRDGVEAAELGAVHQMFGRVVGPDGTPLYHVRTCAPVAGTVRTGADFTVVVPHDLGVLADSDTVVVLAVPDDGHQAGPEATPLAEALGRLRAGTRVAAMRTGAFVLADAGLLDGRRATTHWSSVQEFRRRFPLVVLDPTAPFVDDGDVLTSSDEATGVDMCRHLMLRDLARLSADAVPAIRAPDDHRAASPPIETVQRWALDNLAGPVTLEGLAAHAGLSVRTLTRRFQHEVGVSPLEWVIRQRTARAARLLEQTAATVAQIAASVGFASAACMRQHFARHLHVPPTAYRSSRRLSGSPGEAEFHPVPRPHPDPARRGLCVEKVFDRVQEATG